MQEASTGMDVSCRNMQSRLMSHDFTGFPLDERRASECEHTGLLLAHGVLQRGDDFGGCPVKPKSLVGASNITIFASKKHLPEVAAGPAKQADEAWIQSRDRYLAGQENKIRERHEEFAEALQDLDTKLDVVKELREDSLLHGLGSPSSAADALVQLLNKLRSVYSCVNQTLTPIVPRRMPAPFLPAPEPAPEDCDYAALKQYVEETKAAVASMAAMLRARAGLLRQRLSQIQKEAGPGPNSSSTFFVRSTSLAAIEQSLSSARGLSALLDDLQAAQSGAGPAGGTREVQAKHRPVMPAVMQQVAKTSLFSPEQDNLAFLSAVQRFMQPVFAPAGSALIVAGTVGESMFFVQAGSCAVAVEGAVRGERRAGEFFGEIALLYASERTADVSVSEDAELLRLPKAAFDRVLAAFPHVRRRIADVGAERKRRLEQDYPAPTEEESDDAEAGAVVACWGDIQALQRRAGGVPPDEDEGGEEEGLWGLLWALRESVRRRRVGPDETVLRAGQRRCGLQVMVGGASFVHQGSDNIHPCRPHTVFGLGPLLYSGKMGFDVTAGPAGAEVLCVDERSVFAYLEREGGGVEGLKRLAEAQVEAYESDVWYCV